VSDLLSILGACKDEPDDDSIRLVLADWLEEHGDADRAEFIRLQVAMAHHYGDEPEQPEMEVRANELESQFSEQWLGPLRQLYVNAHFDRGLIEVRATPRQLLDHSPFDLPDEVLPWIEGLYLHEGKEGRADLLASSAMGAFARLDLVGPMFRPSPGGRISDKGFSRLLANPHLTHLRSLKVSYQGLTAASAEALARSERLIGLRHLHLDNNPLGAEGGRALVSGPLLSSITRIDLSDTGLGPEGIAALAASLHVASLRVLALDKERLGAEGGRALAHSPSLGGLSELRLQCAEIDLEALRALAEATTLRPRKLDLFTADLQDDGVEILAASPLLERTTWLDLISNKVSARGARALANSPWLGNLESLALWDPIGNKGVKALASTPVLANLRRLSLHDNEIGPAGARALARSSHLRSVTMLDLPENPLGKEGVRALAEGPALLAVEALDLSQTSPGAKGLRALACSPMATRIHRLNLASNDIGDDEARALAEWPAGALLVELELPWNHIGPGGAAALAGCPGLANLLVLSLYQNKKIGDSGVESIIRSPWLRLARLDLRDNGIGPAGGEALRAWPGRQRLIALWVRDNDMGEELINELQPPND
jgi:uncharacterized protein (TIGR02996 family)